MDTARAAVWHGPARGFRPTDVPLPELGAGEVLVRVRAATLCGSDLHTVAGRRKTDLPTVLGHETVGEVVATGGAVLTVDGTVLTPGTRVTWTVGASCGHCPRCRRGLPQKCATLRKYGHARFSDGASDRNGPRRESTLRTADPWRLSGGLATHCHLLAGTGLVAVPPGLDDTLAAPAGCATATVVGAVHRLAVQPEDAVLVTGCGMLGLTAVAHLRALGVVDVLACDVDGARRAAAAALGATVVTPAAAPAVVRDATAGEGVTVALDFSGSDAAVTAALGLLAVGGRLGLVGSVFPTPGLAVAPEDLVRRCLTVVGVHNYAPSDLVDAVRFLDGLADRTLLAGLVGARHPLSRVAEAFADAATGRAPRVLVTPDGV